MSLLPTQAIRRSTAEEGNFMSGSATLRMLAAAFPAFLLGHDPTKRVIAVSYGSELAIKHANDFRAVLTASWYQSVFPGTQISRTKNTEFEVITTRNGYRLATSIDPVKTSCRRPRWCFSHRWNGASASASRA